MEINHSKETTMQLHTPKAIREIKRSTKSTILINGKKQCKLQAMTFALNYHSVDVTDTPEWLASKRRYSNWWLTNL